MKKLYIHEGEGHYVGSCVIVCSDDEQAAKDMIRQELDSQGLREEELNIIEKNIKNNVIVYSNDGNY